MNLLLFYFRWIMIEHWFVQFFNDEMDGLFALNTISNEEVPQKSEIGKKKNKKELSR